jgi:Clp amino terminal domain, pathogenicity island component
MATTIEFPVDLTPRAIRILKGARAEAVAVGETDFIGAEHVFLAILREGESIPAQIVGRLGYTKAIVEEFDQVLRSCANAIVTASHAARPWPTCGLMRQ